MRGQCEAALPTPVNWRLPCVYPHNTKFSGHVTSGTRPYKFSRAWGRGYLISSSAIILCPTVCVCGAWGGGGGGDGLLIPFFYLQEGGFNVLLVCPTPLYINFLGCHSEGRGGRTMGNTLYSKRTCSYSGQHSLVAIAMPADCMLLRWMGMKVIPLNAIRYCKPLNYTMQLGKDSLD